MRLRRNHTAGGTMSNRGASAPDNEVRRESLWVFGREFAIGAALRAVCHAATTPSGTRGIDRNLTPHAAKIAFETAGATPTIGVSPAPAGGRSGRSTRTTSIGGTSYIRGTGY